jgi:orotate phosphoribosyltransferase
MQQQLLDSLPQRRGHFCYESGHHGELWLDLDDMFVRPSRLQPFVDALAQKVSSHGVEAVCGPLTGGALLAQLIARALGIEFYFTQPVRALQISKTEGTTYNIPDAIQKCVCGKRLAVVDDAINAGSAVRGTLDALRDAGANPIVVGALIVLGDSSAPILADYQLPMERIATVPNVLWPPDGCPLCAKGVLLTAV